jgi:hypothetical protein
MSDLPSNRAQNTMASAAEASASAKVEQVGFRRLPPGFDACTISFAERGRSSVVERQLPKLYVEGSIPFARSKFPLAGQGLVALLRIDAAARDGAADESRQ